MDSKLNLSTLSREQLQAVVTIILAGALDRVKGEEGDLGPYTNGALETAGMQLGILFCKFFPEDGLGIYDALEMAGGFHLVAESSAPVDVGQHAAQFVAGMLELADKCVATRDGATIGIASEAVAWNGMPALSEKLAKLLQVGAKMAGSFRAREVLCYIEEQLTFDETEQATAFLDWIVANGRAYGWNIREVYGEYTSQQQADDDGAPSLGYS